MTRQRRRARRVYCTDPCRDVTVTFHLQTPALIHDSIQSSGAQRYHRVSPTVSLELLR